jgi:hypothetical protein
MRYLRTDDINGAQPRNWGMGGNRYQVAGNPTGNQRSYKNESHVFNHIYEAGNINSHFTNKQLIKGQTGHSNSPPNRGYEEKAPQAPPLTNRAQGPPPPQN